MRADARGWRGLLLGATLMLWACANQSNALSSPRAGDGLDAATPTPVSAMTMAWSTEPDHLVNKFSSTPTGTQARWIFSSYLTYKDVAGVVRPMLAREIPTQDNGDWVLNPDGTMVTTYRLQEDARWHDGTPLTVGAAFETRRWIACSTSP